MKSKPIVSVIISTRNEEENIENCLKSIKAQTYQAVELLVVDNNSSDKTKEIARKYTRLVINKGPERNVQRNYGVKKSSGSYVAWFDADMILTPRIIEECVRKVSQDSSLKALIIPEESVGEGFWADCSALEKRCYLGDSDIEAVRFVEKKAFERVGMLDKNFIAGEDWDITARLRAAGYKTSRVNNFVKHNEGHSKLLNLLRKKYYYATKSLPYIQRHIKSPKDVIFFVIRPAFLRNWKLLASDPLHALGLFIMKFLEFLVGFFGIVKVKISTQKKG